MLVDAESLGVPALSEPQMQLHVRGVSGEATLGKPGTTNDNDTSEHVLNGENGE